MSLLILSLKVDFYFGSLEDRKYGFYVSEVWLFRRDTLPTLPTLFKLLLDLINNKHWYSINNRLNRLIIWSDYLQSIWTPHFIILIIIFLFLLLNLLLLSFFFLLIFLNYFSIFILIVTLINFIFKKILLTTHSLFQLGLSFSFCIKHLLFKCFFPNHKILKSYRSICGIFGSFEYFSWSFSCLLFFLFLNTFN